MTHATLVKAYLVHVMQEIYLRYFIVSLIYLYLYNFEK
jgi:hypothetical protein